MSKVAVLYHNDADGFGSAFAHWSASDEQATYIPVQYGQPVPEIPEGVVDLFIVDFSYDRETCEALRGKYHLTIIDHHKTAQSALKGLDYAFFDMEKSGAVLAWEYFSERPVPELLMYVQDRDLWRWKLPSSEEVNLGIGTLDYDFEVWESADIASLSNMGEAIKNFMGRQLKSSARGSILGNFLGYEGVVIANVTANISEHGHNSLSSNPEAPFSVSYFDTYEGGKALRVYSLRSTDSRVDVGELARTQGGGGHRNAAGFSRELAGLEV